LKFSSFSMLASLPLRGYTKNEAKDRCKHLTRSVCTTRAMNWAAQGGHLEVVKFLYASISNERNAQFAGYLARNARFAGYLAEERGHLEIVEFLNAAFSE